MTAQPKQPGRPKRTLRQRIRAAVVAFRDEPASQPSSSLMQRFRAGPKKATPEEQLRALLRNPLIKRGLQIAGLADLAVPNDPRGEGGALVGAAALVENLIPVLALRQTVEDLNQLRPWWPVVLPLTAWVGYRTYTRERTRVLAGKRPRRT